MSDQLRDLIAEVLDGYTIRAGGQVAADDVLAARLPWLCPDCHGTGEVRKYELDGYNVNVPCTKCPTLADTVALWEAVHGAGTYNNSVSLAGGAFQSTHATHLIHALRAVRA